MAPSPSQHIFMTGGTGYMGRRLIAELIGRGHRVTALVRAASRVPAGCTAVVGDPLDRATFGDRIKPADTFVQLVGTPHPAPWKGRQFRAVDLVSARESIAAARDAGVGHFLYVSVAHPAPIMKAYLAVRAECEAILRDSGMRSTILRPWYVLGPGHWWPVVLQPVYRTLEHVPATADAARRLGLVTIDQMVAALVEAVERPPDRWRIVDVPAIKAAGQAGEAPDW